jgi:hypothetical protein
MKLERTRTAPLRSSGLLVNVVGLSQDDGEVSDDDRK